MHSGVKAGAPIYLGEWEESIPPRTPTALTSGVKAGTQASIWEESLHSLLAPPHSAPHSCAQVLGPPLRSARYCCLSGSRPPAHHEAGCGRATEESESTATGTPPPPPHSTLAYQRPPHHVAGCNNATEERPLPLAPRPRPLAMRLRTTVASNARFM